MVLGHQNYSRIVLFYTLSSSSNFARSQNTLLSVKRQEAMLASRQLSLYRKSELSAFALPVKFREKLSKLFRRVAGVACLHDLKMVPFEGALLGMRRSVSLSWTDTACELLKHDDDVDCLYDGPMKAWDRIDWKAYGLVFVDLRADKTTPSGE
jgi:hypothetical protein